MNVETSLVWLTTSKAFGEGKHHGHRVVFGTRLVKNPRLFSIQVGGRQKQWSGWHCIQVGRIKVEVKLVLDTEVVPQLQH